MKVLVTGGSGFIGSHTVNLLIEQKHDVIIIDNLVPSQKVLTNAKFYQIDICSHQLSEIFYLEKPDYVIHLAAQVSVRQSLENPYYDAKNNILGTINMLSNCLAVGVKKIVFASSAAVYGEPKDVELTELHQTNPISMYGLSKLASERYIELFGKHFGLNYIILRYSNVYGMGQELNLGEGGVVSIFINQILKKEIPIVYGDGNQTRDFIFVKDVARANVTALTKGDREIANISSDSSNSVNELLTKINRITNSEINFTNMPRKEGDILHSKLSNNKARVILNWEPKFSLEDGLKQTIVYEVNKARLIQMEF